MQFGKNTRNRSEILLRTFIRMRYSISQDYIENVSIIFKLDGNLFQATSLRYEKDFLENLVLEALKYLQHA